MAYPELLDAIELRADILEKVKKTSKTEMKGICIVGMGGSSISGMMTTALLSEKASLPILNIRDYKIPSFVDKNWTIIAISYSGNTEETLSAFSDAIDRGCHTFAVTTGGLLKKRAANHPICILPSGFQPRAAFPIIFSAVFRIVEILIGGKPSDMKVLSRSVKHGMSDWGKKLPVLSEMAASLIGKIPLFIGWEHLAPVAYRAKCQMNENCKTLAFSSVLPEADHNEIEAAASCSSYSLIPIFLRSQFEPKRISLRADLTSDIYSDCQCNPIHIRFESSSKLGEMLKQTHYLDMLSVEIAERRGVDPFSVDKITDLKARLAQA